MSHPNREGADREVGVQPGECGVPEEGRLKARVMTKFRTSQSSCETRQK